MNQEGLTTEVAEITEEGKKCAQGRGEKGGVMEWWNGGGRGEARCGARIWNEEWGKGFWDRF